jgi:putative ATP-dependent endonuclease of OLD family
MRAAAITLHNFRTFADAELSLCPYSVLLGANNTGKSNIIDAIRIFYEKDIKYEEDRDFPKFPTPDKEAWIEILFEPTQAEFALLKEEYRLADGKFRVRKYLQSEEVDDEGKPKNNIFAYVGGSLSNSRFYGAKNVQQGKFGEIIYIPAVSKLDEHTKLTGPSALRDLINNVLKKIMGNSPAYNKLINAFESFEIALKTETTPDGQSLQKLESEITAEINEWGTSFEIVVSSVTPDDLVKSLVGHRVRDSALNQPLDTKSYGQGFQRSLIFALIRLAARYNSSNTESTRRDFSPNMTWLLFEEPEAFLHPSQIDALNSSMKTIATADGNQVIITTHNPQFLSRNIEDLPSLARLCKVGPKSTIKQISQKTLQSILATNQQDLEKWRAVGIPIQPDDLQIDMECVKYALWLNPYRCSAFFANKILLVEGATEAALISCMLSEGFIPNPGSSIFVFDSIGKYNIHRFMNLFGEFGISHAVLYDHDNGTQATLQIEKTIKDSRNPFTIWRPFLVYRPQEEIENHSM